VTLNAEQREDITEAVANALASAYPKSPGCPGDGSNDCECETDRTVAAQIVVEALEREGWF
jgi:hypothetical protein